MIFFKQFFIDRFIKNTTFNNLGSIRMKNGRCELKKLGKEVHIVVLEQV